MKINITQKLLVLVPLLAVLAGCASTGNQGGVAPDVQATMGEGNDPGPGHALDIDQSGTGITRAH